MKRNELDVFVADLTELIKATASCSQLDVVEEKANESELVTKTTYARETADAKTCEELIISLTGKGEVSVIKRDGHYWVDVMPYSLEYAGKDSIYIE